MTYEDYLKYLERMAVRFYKKNRRYCNICSINSEDLVDFVLPSFDKIYVKVKDHKYSTRRFRDEVSYRFRDCLEKELRHRLRELKSCCYISSHDILSVEGDVETLVCFYYDENYNFSEIARKISEKFQRNYTHEQVRRTLKKNHKL